jgi:diguanylate cyclase (GGDEF)-like protein/PAS domain S-box-containing protein
VNAVAAVNTPQPSLGPENPSFSFEDIKRLCTSNILSATEDRFFFKDLQSRFLLVNASYLKVLWGGLALEDIVGKTDADLFTDEHAGAALKDEQQIIATGEPILSKVECETFHDRPDTWVMTSKHPLRDEHGAIVGTWGVSRDITLEAQAQKELETSREQLRRNAEEYRLLFEHNPQPMMAYARDTLQFVAVSDSMIANYGYTLEEFLLMTIRDLVPPEDLDELDHYIEATRDGQRRGLVSRPWRHRYKDGTVIDVEITSDDLVFNGRVCRIALAQDVTERNRINAELVIARDAAVAASLHDLVTGLPNRKALMERLADMLALPETKSGKVGLLFVDLDNFKDVNDSLGHDAGDLVLIEIGKRLRKVSRHIDMVTRLGGDEFVLVCPQLASAHDARQIGERVVQAVRQPMVINGHKITIKGSLGAVIATCPSPIELLRQVDIAMYGAKRAGRNRVNVFDIEDQNAFASTSGLALELRRALDEKELFVAYQPLFCLEDGTVSGAEALVRWQHPERGLIPPVEFIALAEERGLIQELDAFVLDEACRQLAEWRALDDTWNEFIIGVNVSGRELNDLGLVTRVASALKRHKIPPNRLSLEITETAFIGELGDADRVVEALRKLDVRIVLDDFGTGYSTLAHIQQLNADAIKIDRSFIAKIGEESRDHKIVGAVIAMAHALDMVVVGEGIETEEQLRKLSEMKCDRGQGFLFAKPLSPTELIARKDAAQERANVLWLIDGTWQQQFPVDVTG